MDSATTEKLVQVPSDCPEYVRCNAPICPLDAQWHQRTYHAGESTCLFLREAMKAGADERLAANPVFLELGAIAVNWIAAERIEANRRTHAGMPRGRGDHLRAVLAAADSGSSIEARAASAERLNAARKPKNA